MAINQPLTKAYQRRASSQDQGSIRGTCDRKAGHPNSKEFCAHAEVTD